MEASAGQVIQNKVRVGSVFVRVAAAFVLIRPLLWSRRLGALGGLNVAVAVREKPRLAAVVGPQQSTVKDKTSTAHRRPIRRQHNNITNSDGRVDN